MKKLWLIIWLHFMVTILNAENFSVQYYNYEDGLPSDLIKQVVEDDLGFVWIATDGGLVRFDGTNFKIFDHNLPSNYVKNIFPVSEKKLLVCTDLGVVRVLNHPLKIKIDTLMLGYHNLNNKRLFYPKTIFKDVNGNLWISEPFSLYRFSKEKPIKRYLFPEYVESGSYLKSFFFFENEKGLLFVLAQTGHAFYYDVKADSFKQIAIDSRPTHWAINSLLKIDDRTALLGTSDGIYEITEFKKSAIRLKRLYRLKKVQALTVGKNGTLWAGTAGSGLYFSHQWQKKKPLTHFKDFKLKVINDLFVNKKGQLWVSSDNGVALIYRPVFEKILSFSNYAVQNLTGENAHQLAATDGQNVYRIYLHTESLKINRIWENPGRVIASLSLGNGAIVVGHFDGKLRFLKNRNVKPISLKSRNTVFSIAFDALQNLWVAQSDFPAVTRVDQTLKTEIYSAERGIVSSPQVIKNFADRILVGAVGDSTYLYEFSAKSNSFKNISVPFGKKLRRQIEIYDLALSPLDSTLYLASNAGIVKIIRQKATVIKLERNRTARSLAIDPQGNLWVGTEHGAYCLIDSLQVYFDDIAGFNNQTFTFRSAAIDEQGRVYLGTYDGIYRQQIAPLQIRATSQPQIIDLI